jgi:adenylate cyclase class 2
MAVEIEIKAHVNDFERIKNKFSDPGGVPSAIEKEDAYWIAPEGLGKTVGSIPLSGVRIRQETKVSASGLREERILVTYKTKERREGIEVNDEREFAVSDKKPFEELLLRLGFKPGLRKYKAGWSWNIGGITAELCRVKGRPGPPGPGMTDLGWFAELEIIAETGDNETVKAASTRLEELLEKAGLPKEAVEERYYSEMLQEEK